MPNTRKREQKEWLNMQPIVALHRWRKSIWSLSDEINWSGWELNGYRCSPAGDWRSPSSRLGHAGRFPASSLLDRVHFYGTHEANRSLTYADSLIGSSPLWPSMTFYDLATHNRQSCPCVMAEHKLFFCKTPLGPDRSRCQRQSRRTFPFHSSCFYA